MAWTLEAALHAALFDAVWVSSEDEAILRIAEKWGALPLWRPALLARDEVSVVQVCLHVVQDFAARGQEYAALYVLLPTSPLRKSAAIRRAWHTFLDSGADALLSVVPVDYPPQWTLHQTAGWLRPLHPSAGRVERQALVPTYRHDGGHAIAWTTALLRDQEFLGPRTWPFRVPAEEAVDINEPMDLARAEFLLQHAVSVERREE